MGSTTMNLTRLKRQPKSLTLSPPQDVCNVTTNKSKFPFVPKHFSRYFKFYLTFDLFPEVLAKKSHSFAQRKKKKKKKKKKKSQSFATKKKKYIYIYFHSSRKKKLKKSVFCHKKKNIYIYISIVLGKKIKKSQSFATKKQEKKTYFRSSRKTVRLLPQGEKKKILTENVVATQAWRSAGSNNNKPLGTERVNIWIA